jgi:hypothetical protein
MNLKKTYDSIRREVLYIVFIEFGISMKLARLIMCLNGTYNNVLIIKHSSDAFPIHNGLKLGNALLPFVSNFALKYTIRKIKKIKWD